MVRRSEVGRMARRRWRGGLTGVSVLLAVTIGTTACGSSTPSTPSSSGVINAVGAENQYANVLAQLGGRYVHVSSILDNPNTDPHTFESSPGVASEVSDAQLVVQNGVGYDDFMTKIEAASPDPHRKVIVVQQLLGLPDDTPNPHLWYKPTTMPAAARAMARDSDRTGPIPCVLLRRQSGHLRSLPHPVARRHRRIQGPLCRRGRGHHRTGG